MNFGEFFFSFLGKCLVMLSMTASYATESPTEFQKLTGAGVQVFFTLISATIRTVLRSVFRQQTCKC